MSGQFPTFGQPSAPGPDAPADETPETPRREPGDGRALKTLLAGAAAVAVLGGGTLGFLWLSSTPGGTTAQAAAGGAQSTPVVTVPDSGDRDPVAFSGAGRDLFASIGGNAAGTGSTAVATTGTGTGTGAGAGAGTGSGRTSATGSATPAKTTTVVAPVRPVVPATTSPVATPAPSTAKPTPGPTRSTAAPWQKGDVLFKELSKDGSDGRATFVLGSTSINPFATELLQGQFVPGTSTVYQPRGKTTRRDMTAEEVTSCQESVRQAVDSAAADKINRATDGCKTVVAYVGQAVFVPSSQAAAALKNTESFGWLVAPGSLVPDAVLGKVTGTVRWLGSRDKTHLVQVNDDQPVWVKEGSAVPGTPLTLESEGLESIDRTDVVVFAAGGNKFFTVLGGGENAGVTY